MREEKNTARALVRIGYDGTVHKFFRAAKAEERFENELKVLKYLEKRQCPFVPRVLGFDRDKLELVTTNCGTRVERMGDEKVAKLFAQLEEYGVRHDDPFLRNITYRDADGRFCLIDFEFATILDDVSQAEGSDVETSEDEAAGSSTARLKWSGRTDCGRFRPNNEDDFLRIAFNKAEFNYLPWDGDVAVDDFDFVFAVSDGMGGERSGEFASKCALDNITRLMPRRYSLSAARSISGIRDCLEDLFEGIHRQLTLLGETYEEGQNMGATLSLIWYVSGRLYFGHIGDSRIYRLPREGGLEQVSHDHTHVGWLRRNGQLNEREARNHPRKNALSQALGAGNQTISPQIGQVACEPGDQFVLCTDGVTDGLWDRAIEKLVRNPSAEMSQFNPAERLVKAAMAEASQDNATAMVIEIA